MHDWEAIERSYGPLVWRTLRRLLDGSDLADCYQETFLRALLESRRNPIKSWPSLLKRLATQRAIDRIRSLARERSRTDGADAVVHLPDHGPGPSQQAVAAELMEALKRAMAQLPRTQAEVFWLRSVEDFSYGEIADQLGMTTNKVGVLLHRARKCLKRKLRTYETSQMRP